MKNLKDYGFNTANSTYIIAEAGINHSGDINVAKKMIDSASRTGADAIKFQTYITEKRTPKDSPIFDILKKCELPFEAFKELQSYSKSKHLDFFSTPFDDESVEYLESINCEIYKIASFDVVNLKLLKRLSNTPKTFIMSVGMAKIDEIEKAYNILKEKTNKIALLHCVSAYPTEEKDANLLAIKSLENKFDCIIGQSDHTNDILVPTYAVAAGAQILEKHFMIDASMDCVDKPVSITETQLSKLVTDVRRLEKILGTGNITTEKAEEGTLVYRRPSTI